MGDSCFWALFPNATCQYKENCKLLQKLVESGDINIKKVPTCRFASGNPNEMFCCPKDPVAEDPIISPTPQHQPTVPVNSKEYVRSPGYYPHIHISFSILPYSFYHLGAFVHFKSDLSDNEYHCTGIVLSATHVLGTSACILGNATRDNPHLIQLRTNDDDFLDKELKVITVYSYYGTFGVIFAQFWESVTSLT